MMIALSTTILQLELLLPMACKDSFIPVGKPASMNLVVSELSQALLFSLQSC